MKHACGMSVVDTIKKYTLTDKEIIVSSLTDVEYSVDLKDEHILIETMINQAKQRNQNVNFKELKNNLKKIKAHIISEIGIISINIGVPFASKEYNEIITMFQLATVLSTILLTLDVKEFIETKKEYEELEKYRIFLEIKEELKKIKSQIILLGSKQITAENININTIDNYTLKEIKKIKTNIKK